MTTVQITFRRIIGACRVPPGSGDHSSDLCVSLDLSFRFAEHDDCLRKCFITFSLAYAPFILTWLRGFMLGVISAVMHDAV